jgi:hypothetical protein
VVAQPVLADLLLQCADRNAEGAGGVEAHVEGGAQGKTSMAVLAARPGFRYATTKPSAKKTSPLTSHSPKKER